jgi:lysophospholipase L1-like esterase
MIELNGLLKNLAVENKNIGFVNIWDAMLGMNGKPVGENFLKDSLHMNANGYRIWQAALAPHLK